MELEMGTHNVHLAGNSRRFVEWIQAAFGAPCVYLPNLYYLIVRRTGIKKRIAAVPCE